MRVFWSFEEDFRRLIGGLCFHWWSLKTRIICDDKVIFWLLQNLINSDPRLVVFQRFIKSTNLLKLFSPYPPGLSYFAVYAWLVLWSYVSAWIFLFRYIRLACPISPYRLACPISLYPPSLSYFAVSAWLVLFHHIRLAFPISLYPPGLSYFAISAWLVLFRCIRMACPISLYPHGLSYFAVFAWLVLFRRMRLACPMWLWWGFDVSTLCSVSLLRFFSI